jgi:regulation of enolase protein 1 (concanavalin A-like superfamily)
MTDSKNMDESVTLAWTEGTWTNEPAAVSEQGSDLLVTAKEGSDAWRTTSYGFIHDSEHALLAPFESGSAVEVSFMLDFDGQFDQAGIFVKVDKKTWIKAGIEFSDGLPQLGAVVTDGQSDWSLSPVPEWAGKRVTIRASRSGDALTLRARTDDTEWRLFRLAPLSPHADTTAGPFLSSPTHGGLTVTFRSWTATGADLDLH